MLFLWLYITDLNVHSPQVSKTHDQDIDADLYKDGFFRRVTRYLCHSKVDGYMGYVVEQLAIVTDRDSRPTGYTIVEQTFDTSNYFVLSLWLPEVCKREVFTSL